MRVPLARGVATVGLTVLVGWLTGATRAAAEEPVRLEERFAVGTQYHVSTRVDLSGSLTEPAEKGKPAPKPVTLRGDGVIEYDERVLSLGKDGAVTKTARICRRTDIRRTLADQPQESFLRKEVRRLILLRHDNKEVPFSPDGPLTWGEIDLIRTDVFTPALVGLLPDRAVRVGDRWTATDAAVRELTDQERIDEGRLECRLDGVEDRDGRRLARVALAGTVRGLNEDGPSRQKLSGYFLFDLGSNHLAYLYLDGVHSLLDKDGREVGRVEGRFALSRRANTTCPELADEALRGVPVEPDADNTLLLYDNPDLGLRFLHPRRWRVAGVRGPQVALDSADGGSGLLLTVEPPARVPTGAQFQAESRDWLTKQKAKLLGAEPVKAVRADPPLEHFGLEAELNGQKFVMDYYVTRQGAGGAVVAARLVGDLPALRKEVERVARSVTVTKRPAAPGGK
jgi:hypothetical protein